MEFSYKTSGSCWRKWVSVRVFTVSAAEASVDCFHTSPLKFPPLSVSQVSQRKALGADHVQDPCLQGGRKDGPLRPDAGESWMSGMISE